MHRLIRDHLEEVLAGSLSEPEQTSHLHNCEECLQQIEAMREHSALLREFQVPASLDVGPKPGFYARVMERIDARRGSIWSVFETSFGRRIALASVTLAVLLSVYLVTSEQVEQPFDAGSHPVQVVVGEDQPGMMLTGRGVPDRDAVLLNLVTYQEQ